MISADLASTVLMPALTETQWEITQLRAQLLTQKEESHHRRG